MVEGRAAAIRSERLARAIAALADCEADLRPLRAMGLTSAELADLLIAAPWGEAAPRALRPAVEQLYETRRSEEERAGVAIPVVVVKPEVRRFRRRAIAACIGVAVVYVAWLALR